MITKGYPLRSAAATPRSAHAYEMPPMPGAAAEPTEYHGLHLRPPAPWGTDNREPERLAALVQSNPLLAAAVEFKAALLAGDGVVPVRRALEGDRWRYTPCYEYEEVNAFLEDNDIDRFIAEQAVDAVVLGNVFPEFVLSGDHSRIAELNHLEGATSRLESAAPGGRIYHHYYAAGWAGSAAFPEGMIVTPVLPPRRTAETLRCWMGLAEDPTGRHRARPRVHRYVLPAALPGPGRGYYGRPGWTALRASGWLDFATAIPTYKKAVLDNGTIIRYHVRIHPDFWRGYYASQDAQTPDEQRAAREAWLGELDAFLGDPGNTGKAFISEKVTMGGELASLIDIEPIRTPTPGGELLADVEETSNIIAYGMGIHPSLIGASPGRSKTISGTEARELFIIKQAMIQSLRHRLLRPLHIVKRVNGWPDDIHFRIANLELTTLDQNTGARRSIGQDAVENLS